MEQAIQQQQQQIEHLTQQLQAMQVQLAEGQQPQPAGPAAPVIRWNLKFDTFSFEGPNPAQDYDRFEQNCRMVCQVMRYNVPEVCYAILGQLRGKAADMGRSLVGTERDYADLNAFLNRLRSLFVSPAYREKARSAFLSRIQQPDESIIAFHGILRSLWEKAYTEAERQEVHLIRQFVAGIQDIRVNEKLHLNPQADYNATLTEALRLEGTFEVINIEAKRRNLNGKMNILQSQTFVPASNNGPEAMEIGNVSIHQNRYPRGRGGYYTPNRGRGYNNAYSRNQYRGNYYQSRGRSQYHYGSGNRSQSYNNYEKKKEETNKNQPQESVAAIAKDECKRCHQKGHWAKNCPKKPWELKNRRGNWKPNHYSGRNTNAIGAEDENDQDDSQEEDSKN